VVDFERIEGFDWDAGNERKSAAKHHVSQAEAESAFFNHPILVVPDERHSQSEPRLHLLSCSDTGRFLHITVTVRRQATLIRIISARDMNRKERMLYEKASQETT